jgi:Glycosyltransferase like family
MISVVCVYNDKNVLDQFLLKSLETQKNSYDLILVDNTQKNYNSAAEALNYGGKDAFGEYIMFTHQDVDLCSNTFLKDLEIFLNKIPNLGIAGVVGKSLNHDNPITNIKHGIPPRNVSPNKFKKPGKVQTVDECLFVIPTNLFNRLNFDAELCDGWHLYAVDYCLSCISCEFDVYVIPLVIHHKSIGYSLSVNYYKTVRKLLKKHENDHEKIHTTMGNWNIKDPLILQIIKQQINWNLSKIKNSLW